MWRQQEDAAFIDRNIARPTFLHHPKNHVPLKLVEELFIRVIMKVGPAAWPTDDHHNEVGVFPNDRIANRRLQKIAMRIDPCVKVERLQFGHPSPLGDGFYLAEIVACIRSERVDQAGRDGPRDIKLRRETVNG